MSIFSVLYHKRELSGRTFLFFFGQNRRMFLAVRQKGKIQQLNVEHNYTMNNMQTAK